MPPKKYVPLPAKECQVIVWNISKSVSLKGTQTFQDMKKAVTLIVKNKIRYSPKTELALVLMGVDQDKENTDYTAVRIEFPMGVASLEMLQQIEGITSCGEQKSDISDGILAAFDVIQEKCGKNKWAKRVTVITDAHTPMGSTNGYISVLQGPWTSIDFIGTSFSDGFSLEPKEEDNDTQPHTALFPTEEKIKKLCDTLKIGQYFYISLEYAISSLHGLKSKKINTRTGFRGALEIGEDFKIPIWLYKKTDRVVIPPAKKTTLDSGEVIMDRVYTTLDDPDTPIEEDARVRAYKYGKDYVAFDEMIRQEKFVGEKGMKVIGFCDRNDIPRHHFMNFAYQVVSDPESDPAAPAIYSLVQACSEMNRAVIVRYVRTASSAPYIGALLPVLKSNIAYFHFVILPYARDLREYPFKSFDKIKHTTQQLETTEMIINSMNLMEQEGDDDDKVEVMKPKDVFNPMYQHFLNSCHERVLNPTNPVPTLDPLVAKDCLPEKSPESFYPKMLTKSKDVFEQYKARFTLNPVDRTKEKSNAKRFWFALDENVSELESYKKTKPNESDDMDLVQTQVDADILASKTSIIGTRDPKKDFLDIIGRRDVDMFLSAMDQLEKIVFQLVNDSIEDQFYEKALDCVVEARRQCIKDLQSDRWNSMLRKIKIAYSEGSRSDFWTIFKVKNISLISNEEEEKSIVTKDEASKFLQDKVEKSQAIARLAPEPDTLLDELE